MPHRFSARFPAHLAALALGGLCGLFGPATANANQTNDVTAEVAAGASDAPPSPPTQATPSPLRIGLATGAAIVPGFLVHGAGTFASGDTRTALRLLAWEGAGLGMFLAGGLGLVFTGASRKTVIPFSTLTMGGLGLFAISWLADIYSTLSPAFRPGRPMVDLPEWELELGYLGVAGGPFSVGQIGTLGFTARPGAWRFNGGVELAVDADNRRFSSGLARRFYGPVAAGPIPGDDSYLEVEARGSVHTFGEEGFKQGTGDLLLRGRYALSRSALRLTGAFAEMAVGIGLESYHFEQGTDLNNRLLGEVGFGTNVGRGGPLRGEFMAFYDHRKDGFTGGLPLFGIAGHAGLRGRMFWGPRWGLAAEVAAGRSTTGRLSLVYSGGRS
jgi:hypothetical protein